MRLLKRLFVLMVAAVAIGLSSCAKEEVSPPVVDADASEMIYANAGGEREEDPDEDCRCEMRVDSVSGIDTAVLWSILNYSPMAIQPFEIEGKLDSFRVEGGTTYLPLPSDFRELNSPSAGTHVFWIYNSDFSQSQIKIYTQVRCYTQNDDGSETLATTTYHSFSQGDGTSEGLGFFSFPAITTSCLDQSAGGGVQGP